MEKKKKKRITKPPFPASDVLDEIGACLYVDVLEDVYKGESEHGWTERLVELAKANGISARCMSDIVSSVTFSLSNELFRKQCEWEDMLREAAGEPTSLDLARLDDDD